MKRLIQIWWSAGADEGRLAAERIATDRLLIISSAVNSGLPAEQVVAEIGKALGEPF